MREIAIRNKRMIKNGGKALKEKRAQQAKDKSLKEIALIVHKMIAKTYKNEKYAAQWLSSLENHVFPKIGQKSVSSINSADILSVLSPIWVDKPDIAKKIKQRLSQITTWAKGMTEEQYAEFLSIVSLACRTNHLLNGIRVPVDQDFNHF